MTESIAAGFGYLFIGIGLAVAIGGGGVPPFGLKTGFRLYVEYKALIAAGEELSLDQKVAHHTFVSYGIAVICIVFGLFFLFISKFIR